MVVRIEIHFGTTKFPYNWTLESCDGDPCSDWSEVYRERGDTNATHAGDSSWAAPVPDEPTATVFDGAGRLMRGVRLTVLQATPTAGQNGTIQVRCAPPSLLLSVFQVTC